MYTTLNILLILNSTKYQSAIKYTTISQSQLRRTDDYSIKHRILLCPVHLPHPFSSISTLKSPHSSHIFIVKSVLKTQSRKYVWIQRNEFFNKKSKTYIIAFIYLLRRANITHSKPIYMCEVWSGSHIYIYKCKNTVLSHVTNGLQKCWIWNDLACAS